MRNDWHSINHDDVWRENRQRHNPKDYAELVVCKGKPMCMAEDQECIYYQSYGCPNCRHIVQAPTGTYEYRIKAN